MASLPVRDLSGEEEKIRKAAPALETGNFLRLASARFLELADVQSVGLRAGVADDLLRDLGVSFDGLAIAIEELGASLLQGLGIGIGFLLLIVPGLFLLTIWALVPPVVVLERPGVLAAFGRSRELVRGNGWQVLGVIAVFVVIVIVVSLIFGLLGNALGSVGAFVLNILGSALTAPLVALAAAVLYFNLRAVKGETAPPPRAVGLNVSGGPPAVGTEPPFGPQEAPPSAERPATPGWEQTPEPGGEPPSSRQP